MILSDNETKFDLLNNEAIAKTVVNLIKESNNQPISIGIHGDWGAGKSSILEMIEDLFNHTDKDDGKKYCCIRFNGWKHQGFEDSKIALMSAIVSELTAKENLQETAKEILGKLWKNINWMTVAKTAGKTALGIATGTAPIAVLSSVRDMLKSTVTTQEGIANAIDVIGGYLKESKITEDTSSNTEFTEFHKNFKELLEKANIKKLVVLIDDLDRCLPDVAINTLEAVRLFMFTGETAFVVAADESMIRYAVKKHFPDVVDENKYNVGIEFSNKYLEKLIQVPFRIPALGEVEACNYIMLLMVGSVLSEENTNYKALRSEGISRIKKPWDVRYFTVSDVQKILKDDYAKASNETLIATQIGHLLSHNTDGNPRKIKRFINSRASLFSGGMDSLISTINLMEQKENTLLFGHAGEGLTKNAQTNILNVLNAKYPEIEHTLIDLWMSFPDDYIPEGGNDANTRSRSFLFIGFALFSITGTKNIKELMIPENGLIALNIPLEITRVGSFSTRTTHPFYLSLWNNLLKNLGMELSVYNPYWNKTKGEMANECLNKDILFETMGLSFSCSSPGKARWKGLSPQHCGYCVPCLIRRAAMHKAFGRDSTVYTETSLHHMQSSNASGIGVQLRSFQYAIEHIKKHPDIERISIHKSGPLPQDEDYLSELASTYRRGLLEVDAFIQDGLNHEERHHDL